MLYKINRLNRTVDLDDILVNKYCEYETLRDQPFSIVIRSKYGHCPTKEELSDEELSKICNEVLFSELKALALLPKALSVVAENYDDFVKQTKENKIIKYSL